MKLYEIDAAILALVDLETGEIADYEAFEKLTMERESKIENLALWYKDLVAEADAIRAEEKKLAERRKACENNAERLKEFLTNLLGGEKFKTPRVVCTYRTSTAVSIADEAAFIRRMTDSGNFDYLTPQDPKINKTAIGDAIKQGATIEGAEIIKRSSIQIK